MSKKKAKTIKLESYSGPIDDILKLPARNIIKITHEWEDRLEALDESVSDMFNEAYPFANENVFIDVDESMPIEEFDTFKYPEGDSTRYYPIMYNLDDTLYKIGRIYTTLHKNGSVSTLCGSCLDTDIPKKLRFYMDHKIRPEIESKTLDSKITKSIGDVLSQMSDGARIHSNVYMDDNGLIEANPFLSTKFEIIRSKPLAVLEAYLKLCKYRYGHQEAIKDIIRLLLANDYSVLSIDVLFNVDVVIFIAIENNFACLELSSMDDELRYESSMKFSKMVDGPENPLKAIVADKESALRKEVDGYFCKFSDAGTIMAYYMDLCERILTHSGILSKNKKSEYKIHKIPKEIKTEFANAMKSDNAHNLIIPFFDTCEQTYEILKNYLDEHPELRKQAKDPIYPDEVINPSNEDTVENENDSL